MEASLRVIEGGLAELPLDVTKDQPVFAPEAKGWLREVFVYSQADAEMGMHATEQARRYDGHRLVPTFTRSQPIDLGATWRAADVAKVMHALNHGRAVEERLDPLKQRLQEIADQEGIHIQTDCIGVYGYEIPGP